MRQPRQSCGLIVETQDKNSIASSGLPRQAIVTPKCKVLERRSTECERTTCAPSTAQTRRKWQPPQLKIYDVTIKCCVPDQRSCRISAASACAPASRLGCTNAAPDEAECAVRRADASRATQGLMTGQFTEAVHGINLVLLNFLQNFECS
eukprot:2342677-Pleurochrysis_carterae.AAC.6